MLHVTYQNHMKQNLPYPQSRPFIKEHLHSPPAPQNLNIFYKSESPCNFISTTAKTEAPLKGKWSAWRLCEMKLKTLICRREPEREILLWDYY